MSTASRAVAVALAFALLVPVAHALLPSNPWMARRVLHIAHQGGELEAPSNTLYAFKTALAKGADVLEMDVHRTADGHVVVLHDATVDRTTDGSGRVDALTLVQLKALDAAYWFVPGRNAVRGEPPGAYVWRGVATGAVPPPPGFGPNDFTIPTLSEVLAAFPTTLLNIEIKASAPDTIPYEEDLAALLSAHGRGTDTIVVSFGDHATEKFRLHDALVGATTVSTATGTAETAAFWASAQGPLPGSKSHHHALQVPMTFQGITVVTPDFIARAHANGLAVHVWTVDDPATMHALVDWGVDGIMSAKPTSLEAVLQSRNVAWTG